MKSITEKMSSSKGVSITDTLTEVIDSAGGLTILKVVNKYRISNQKWS